MQTRSCCSVKITPTLSSRFIIAVLPITLGRNDNQFSSNCLCLKQLQFFLSKFLCAQRKSTTTKPVFWIARDCFTLAPMQVAPPIPHEVGHAQHATMPALQFVVHVRRNGVPTKPASLPVFDRADALKDLWKLFEQFTRRHFEKSQHHAIADASISMSASTAAQLLLGRHCFGRAWLDLAATLLDLTIRCACITSPLGCFESCHRCSDVRALNDQTSAVMTTCSAELKTPDPIYYSTTNEHFCSKVINSQTFV
jgi:hypothetical protein